MGPQTIFKSSLLSGSKLGCLNSKVKHEGSIRRQDRVKAPRERERNNSTFLKLISSP